MLIVAYLPLWPEADPWRDALRVYRLVVNAGD
jgi:hypothetical protein